MTENPDRMSSGEFQTIREYLGLTTPILAAILHVRNDTVRKWETGREIIPIRVREEIEHFEEETAQAVEELITALNNMRTPTVAVYRTDAEMHAARPDTAHLTARWWRHVVARAAHEVPGVEIVPFRDPHTK